MASFTIKAIAVCSGGGHVRLQVTGAATEVVEISVEEFRNQVIDSEFKKDFLMKALKVHFIGKTAQEIKDELTSVSGVQMEI